MSVMSSDEQEIRQLVATWIAATKAGDADAETYNRYCVAGRRNANHSLGSYHFRSEKAKRQMAARALCQYTRDGTN
jgi:hypothetical protein